MSFWSVGTTQEHADIAANFSPCCRSRYRAKARTVALYGLVAGLLCAQAKAEIQIEIGPLLDIGEQWARENLPADWQEDVDMPSEQEWQGFFKAAATALESGNVEDAARLMPYAETAVRIVARIPGYEDYAAWLQQRLDYFEMAAAAVKSSSDSTAPAGGGASSTPSGKPMKGRVVIVPAPVSTPPPEIPVSLEQRRQSAVSQPTAWKRKLQNRRPPESARTLVPALKRIFREEGVPPELVWIAEAESSMNPRARNPSGATGLFQLMPSTARRYGLRLWPADERKKPEPSARAAARYLKFLYGEFNSWPLAIAAYNAGEGRVKKLMDSKRAKTFDDLAPHLPIETRMYVPKVQAIISLREGRSEIGSLPAWPRDAALACRLSCGPPLL